MSKISEWNSGSLHSVDHFEICMSRNLEMCVSPHILLVVYFSFRYISCQKASRSGRVEMTFKRF